MYRTCHEPMLASMGMPKAILYYTCIITLPEVSMNVISNKPRFLGQIKSHNHNLAQPGRPSMADSIEVRLRPALGHREGELTRCRSPLVSRENSRYSSCTACYSMENPQVSGSVAMAVANGASLGQVVQ